MPRFVVLYHQLPDDQSHASHWDLMFEQEEVLRTWAVDQPPFAKECLALELPDHRPFYLGYEGPISGNRGFVTRWDGGEYTLVEEQVGRVCFELEGSKLQGRLTLTRKLTPEDSGGEVDHFWIVSFSGASATDSSRSSEVAGS